MGILKWLFNRRDYIEEKKMEKVFLEKLEKLQDVFPEYKIDIIPDSENNWYKYIKVTIPMPIACTTNSCNVRSKIEEYIGSEICCWYDIVIINEFVEKLYELHVISPVIKSIDCGFLNNKMDVNFWVEKDIDKNLAEKEIKEYLGKGDYTIRIKRFV